MMDGKVEIRENELTRRKVIYNRVSDIAPIYIKSGKIIHLSSV